MESQMKREDYGSSPSFNVYSSDSLTSKAVTKVIREEEATHIEEFYDVNEDDFAFSFKVTHGKDSPKDIDTQEWTVFPVFNRVLDNEAKAKDDKKSDVSVSITGPLLKLFIDKNFASSSYSESESESESELEEGDNGLENTPSGTFCVWRPKVNNGTSSPNMTKCKKSSSTGSGSKRWSIRYLLKRNNSEGKDPMVLLSPKKVDSPKQKVARRLKGQTPVHEQFYVQRRAENEIVKRKTFLPYRQDLVGLFANVNGMGKMLPF